MGFHETIADDEAARFAGYAQELVDIQRARDAKSGKFGRALHVKQHVGAVGELVVTATAGAGVFATPGQRYPVYARFSNASSRRQNDKLPDARGFAIKLVGVPGKKLIPGMEQEVTQDFLMLSDPAIAFRDPHEFMIFQRAIKDGPLPLLPRMLAGYGLRRGFQVIGRLLEATKVSSFATVDFHTAAPIAWGDSAAKLALFPTPSAAPAVAPATLRDDLTARLEAGPLTWTLRAQLFVDDQTTPIEDTSVAWSGPWIDLAQLTLQKRDPARAAEIDARTEQLSFDPWHAIEAHRPLGAIMRCRAATYGPSIQGRKGGPEPTSVPEVDASSA